MDGSVREPVTAQLPVSLFTPPSSIACGDKHVAESGGDTSVLQAFPDSIPFPVQVDLRGPQTAPAAFSPGADCEAHSLEAPFKFLAAAAGHCSETEDLGGTLCKQAPQRAPEAPGAFPHPETNRAMPRAAASFSLQENDAAEPPGRPPAACMCCCMRLLLLRAFPFPSYSNEKGDSDVFALSGEVYGVGRAACYLPGAP